MPEAKELGLHPWQQQAKFHGILKLPSGEKVLLKQPREWLLCSVYANHLSSVVMERPVNYLRAGVILFAVYKQMDGVWLALKNAASEDNRFRTVCTKACLSVLFVEVEISCIFGLIKILSLPSNLVLFERCSLLKEKVLHRKDLLTRFALL